jgi:transposase-like protein
MPKASRKAKHLAVVSVPERSEGALTTAAPIPPVQPVPDPEVPSQAQRRRFSAEYKLSILKQADACRQPGELGALLRREGLYSSLLSIWRRQRDQGALGNLSRRRGPKSRRPDPRVTEMERENRRLQKELQMARAIIEVQKKVSALLGIPLNQPGSDEND